MPPAAATASLSTHRSDDPSGFELSGNFRPSSESEWVAGKRKTLTTDTENTEKIFAGARASSPQLNLEELDAGGTPALRQRCASARARRFFFLLPCPSAYAKASADNAYRDTP